MDNNFNNETNDNNPINSGFEAPDANNPLNIEFEEPYVQAPSASTTLASAKPKKSRKWLIPTIASLGVAIAACVCCVLFIPQVNNFFKINTQSPTSYYKDVEKAAIEDQTEENAENLKKMTTALSQVTSNLATADDITNMFGMTSSIAPNTAAFSGVTITLNDEFKDYVKSYIAKDGGMSSTLASEFINSFDSITIDNITMISDKNQISTDLSITLNKTKIISVNLIVDLKDYVVYFSVPELTDTVFSIKIPQRVINEFKDDFEENSAMLKEIFGQFDAGVQYLDENNEELAEFIEKYAIIIVDSFDGAELSKSKEVDVNDVTVEYTEIVIKVDQKMAADIAKNVMEELKDDEFAIGFANAIGISKDEYNKTISDILEEAAAVDSDKNSDATVDLYTYVNNKGEIVGRGIAANGDVVTYVTYEKDDECQFQLTITETNCEFIVRGKSTGKDSKSGKVILESQVDDDKISFTCEFTNVQMVNEDLGYCTGIFALTTTYPELEPFELIFKLDADKTTQNITIDLLYNDMKTITLDFSVGQGEYKEIKLPGNTFELKEELNGEVLIPELRKINLVALKSNLKNAMNSETISSTIDTYFAQYGLDAMDGDMTDEEVTNLVKTIATLTGVDDEYYEDTTIEEIETEVEKEYEDVDDERTGDDGDPSQFMDFYYNGPN